MYSVGVEWLDKPSVLLKIYLQIHTLTKLISYLYFLVCVSMKRVKG